MSFLATIRLMILIDQKSFLLLFRLSLKLVWSLRTSSGVKSSLSRLPQQYSIILLGGPLVWQKNIQVFQIRKIRVSCVSHPYGNSFSALGVDSGTYFCSEWNHVRRSMPILTDP